MRQFMRIVVGGEIGELIAETANFGYKIETQDGISWYGFEEAERYSGAWYYCTKCGRRFDEHDLTDECGDMICMECL